MTFYKWQEENLVLYVQIQPKSSKDEVVGIRGETLKIKITAPPIDGKANAHLCNWIAKLFDVPKSRVSILKGETHKIKTLLIKQPQQLPDWII
ncbi:MAG: hypothetical protein RIT27_210 [Pseudomonadota bacterium]|jgi:uncharacterized protein (TIGR00251 family)